MLKWYVQITDSCILVLEPDILPVVAILVKINISLANVLLLILGAEQLVAARQNTNILVREPDIPVVMERIVIINMQNAIVPVIIYGVAENANQIAPVVINILARALMKVQLELLVAENIHLAPVLLLILGAAVIVFVHPVINILVQEQMRMVVLARVVGVSIDLVSAKAAIIGMIAMIPA